MKDYAKKTPQSNQPKNPDYGIWVSLALIIFAVSFVAYATYHAMHRKASVEKEKHPALIATPSESEKSTQQESRQQIEKKIPVQIIKKTEAKAKPAKSSTTPHSAAKTDEPKFDFYTLLPEMTVEVPADDETTDDAAATPVATPESIKTEKQTGNTQSIPEIKNKKTALDSGDIYVLQVASLHSASDAAHIESLLREIGYNTFIQHYETTSHETGYRIMVGPFHSIQEADAAQSKLYAHQMEAILLKKN